MAEWERAGLTLAEAFEAAAGGEALLFAVASERWEEDFSQSVFAGIAWRRLYPWAEMRPLIDHPWRRGHGGPGCPAVVAWSASWVVGVHEYDGATCVVRVPRNPTAHDAAYL